MKVSLIWPQEPTLPSSLFKHFGYLGEVGEYLKQVSDVSIDDLSVESKTRGNLINLVGGKDLIMIPVEPYSVRESVDLSTLIHQVSDAKVIAYGTVASMNPNILEDFFDYVVVRDSWEKAFEKLITSPDEFRRLLDGNKYSIEETLPSDQWTFPAEDLLPMDKYYSLVPNQLELRVQRGCKHK